MYFAPDSVHPDTPADFALDHATLQALYVVLNLTPLSTYIHGTQRLITFDEYRRLMILGARLSEYVRHAVEPPQAPAPGSLGKRSALHRRSTDIKGTA